MVIVIFIIIVLFLCDICLRFERICNVLTQFYAKFRDVNVNVPTAPEVGLYLDECFFASYNQKWGDSHEELSMKDYEQEAEDFKMKHIYPHIASTEQKEGVVGLWLHSLNHRNYPDLCTTDADNDGNTSNEESVDVGNVEE